MPTAPDTSSPTRPLESSPARHPASSSRNTPAAEATIVTAEHLSGHPSEPSIPKKRSRDDLSQDSDKDSAALNDNESVNLDKVFCDAALRKVTKAEVGGVTESLEQDASSSEPTAVSLKMPPLPSSTALWQEKSLQSSFGSGGSLPDPTKKRLIFETSDDEESSDDGPPHHEEPLPHGKPPRQGKPSEHN